jgi:anti-sigma factor RsiW
MRCAQFDGLIALEIEGDLPERQSRRVEEHLRSCPGCRAFAEELKESQAALKGLARETVVGLDFQQLRGRVLEEISREQSRSGTGWRTWLVGGRRRAVLAGFAVALLAGGALYLARWDILNVQPGSRLREARTVTRNAALPDSPVTGRSQVQPFDETGTQAAQVEPAAFETAAPAPLIIKLLTDDPDVVIILIADGKEDQKNVPTV